MIRKSFLSLLFTLIIWSSCYSQFPRIQWERSLGGSSSDVGFDVVQTTDSGFITIGWSNSSDSGIVSNHGGVDAWVVKLTASGMLQWQKCFGGSGDDRSYAIVQTLDNGYVFAGTSSSSDGDVPANHGGNDWWIVKINDHGILQWKQSVGGSSEEFVYGSSCITNTSDSGVVICGYSDSNDGNVHGNHGGLRDVCIIKLDKQGLFEWEKSLGGSGTDCAFSLIQTIDGCYTIAGESTSQDGDVTGNHGNTDYWIVRTDSVGTIQWQKSFGGSRDEEANAIIQTSEGGYLVVGHSSSTNGDVVGVHSSVYPYDFNDCWILKLDSTGGLEWQKALGGSGDDGASSVIQDVDGGYIIAGTTSSNDGDVYNCTGIGYNYWLLKLNTIGGIEWQKCFGGGRSDVAESVIQSGNGGYIVVGESASNDGDVSNHNGESTIIDYWVVKLGLVNDVNNIEYPDRYKLFPNPSARVVNVSGEGVLVGTTLTITDLTGREITETKLKTGSTQLVTETFPNGIYFVTISNGEHTATSKLIIQK